jgi:N-acetyl-gamma-glutamyl-phosphate reductase
VKDIHEALSEHYAGQDGEQGVHVASMEESAEETAVARHLSGMPHVDAEALTGSDKLTIHVFGNEERQQAVVCAVLDNLGKGAAGQAVQNLELMLGLSHE